VVDDARHGVALEVVQELLEEAGERDPGALRRRSGM
jgi:hypothetical protein